MIIKLKNKNIMKQFINNIKFIKYYKLGKELYKNPPRIIMPEGSELNGYKFVNTTLMTTKNNVISNCEFKGGNIEIYKYE